MHEGTCTLELQGPILPCALDELVRAPVKILVNDPHQLFMHDKSSNAEAQGLKLQRTTVVDAEDPGSHYLLRVIGIWRSFTHGCLGYRMTKRNCLPQIIGPEED